jgi:putative membrane protein
MNSTHAWVAGAAALGIAALGCGAVSAQTTAEPNPAQVTPSTGVSSAVAEPSAATPRTDGDSGRVDRAATQRFVNEAADANLAEIAAGHYAVEHSQSPEVNQFAQKMIHDHTVANDQLTMIAMAHGYGIPLAPSQRDEVSLKRLEQVHGRRFNADYSKAQESDHREVISMFRRAAQDPSIAPQVRQFAQQALPQLQDHLHMANQLVAAEAGGNRSAG